MVAGKRCFLIALIVSILICGAGSAAADPAGDLSFIIAAREREDSKTRAERISSVPSGTSSELKMLMLSAVRLYQILISTQDRPGCMFHPSCSEYAKLAIGRYGILIGLLMAADRLQRCNGVNRELYPLDPVRGKLLDPVPERPGGKRARWP